MFQLINHILLEFKGCFKRAKTWQWFLVLVIGFITRNDLQGVTSVISDLRLNPSLYHTMLHFFRSTAYKLKDLYDKWIKIAIKHGAFVMIAERVVLLGDHIKISKEGRHMPGIQTLHQESNNSAKPKFIEGHTFAQISAVITNGQVSRSLPLMTQRQESPQKEEDKKKKNENSLVVQMVNAVHETAKSLDQPVVAALDAYFSSESAWSTADKTIMETGERFVEIVTRAQTNTVAFTDPEPPKVKKPGHPRKYGEKVNLYNIFGDMSKFTQTIMILYGKKAKVQYLCMDLIWKPVKKHVRFVLVKINSGCCILMSTSLTLSPENIIKIYALRFKIETSFNEQKNNIGSFAYHFWTTALSKRKRWSKIKQPSDPNLLKRIEKAEQATESFVCLCTIATGILSIIAFTHSCEIWKHYPGWIKTLRSTIPTIAIVKNTLAHDLPAFLKAFPNLLMCSIINSKARLTAFIYDDCFFSYSNTYERTG